MPSRVRQALTGLILATSVAAAQDVPRSIDPGVDVQGLLNSPQAKEAERRALRCSIVAVMAYSESNNDPAKDVAEAAYFSCLREWQGHARALFEAQKIFGGDLSESKFLDICRQVHVPTLQSIAIEHRNKSRRY